MLIFTYYKYLLLGKCLVKLSYLQICETDNIILILDDKTESESVSWIFA